MSTYNADTDYELIDYFGLFDLANARVVQAQINTIDGETNSANVTLSGECADLATVDTSEVKFFYHCENSTGTLEDLANGFKAFKADDFVYCLYMPYVSDDVPERFFIIGHVDLKGTTRCATGDFILIVMDLHRSFNYEVGLVVEESWFTIYDAATGATLNLSTFVALPGSPAPPAALPAMLTTEASAWIDFNFGPATPAHSCPLVVEPYEASYSIASRITDDDYNCTYHARAEYTDGGYSDSTATAVWSDPNYTYNEYDHLEADREDYSTIPTTRIGFGVFDGVTWAYKHDLFGMTVHVTGAASVDRYSSETSTSNVSISENINCVSEAMGVTFDLLSYSASAPFGLDFDEIYFPSAIAFQTGTSVVGAYGLYVLSNIRNDSYFSAASGEIDIVSGGSFAYPCNEYIPYAQSLIYPWETATVYERAKYKVFGLSYCCVSIFEEVPGEKPYTLSPHVCMAASNTEKSNGLAASFADLKKKIYELTNNTNVFGTWAWEKPRVFSALTKKVPENA